MESKNRKTRSLADLAIVIPRFSKIAYNQKEADYYVFREHSINNTFSKEQADRYVDKWGPGIIEKIMKLPLVNINKVIKDNFDEAPNLFSIDVEGLDLAILETLDFDRFRPSLFCIETLVFGTTRIIEEILDFMKAKDYSIRGSTFVNTIFVDNRLLT